MKYSGWLCRAVQRLLIMVSVLMLSAVLTQSQTASNYDVLVHHGKAQLEAGSNDLALSSANSAIKLNAGRWEAYALAGGALMNLKRYEEAADDFSHAIDHAPEAKQQGLRDLRRQCFTAETGPSPTAAPPPQPSAMQAEVVLWKSIENSTNADDFKTYLQSYPNGAFAPLGQRHLDELEAQADRERQMRQEKAEREAKQRAQELATTFPVIHNGFTAFVETFQKGLLVLVSGGIEFRATSGGGFHASCSDTSDLKFSKYVGHPPELRVQGKKYVFFPDEKNPQYPSIPSTELLQRIAEHCGIKPSP